MRNILPKQLHTLAKACPKPLYVVGGSVRDFLSGLSPKNHDWDICAPIPSETFAAIATNCGFSVKSVYKTTGTVKLHDADKNDYEFSCFRSDEYVRGTHVPVSIYFTDDIVLDAKRRDFTANAVYYDVANDCYLDPLLGIDAIKDCRLTTVCEAQKVFGEDGLRLMRLARQAAQLNFQPDEDCFNGAKLNATLIRDISAERIFTELTAILHADEKYGFSDGPYHGLSLLDQTRVLDEILPELTLGRDMQQRPDFHKYTVLEHSLRTVKYADKKVRLAALLHDVGKPFCKQRDGNSFAHNTEGARIAKEILQRLKAPKKLIERIPALVELHMYDFDCKTSENKLRRFFAENYTLLDELLLLKQADYSACTDDLSIAPTCKKWMALLEKMKSEQAPFTLSQLAVSGKDLLDAKVTPSNVSKILHALLLHAVVNPNDNTKARLLKLAPAIERNI